MEKEINGYQVEYHLNPNFKVVNFDVKLKESPNILFFDGYIEQNGNSSWSGNSCDDSFIHINNYKQAVNIGLLFEFLYLLAVELMPEHENDILGYG